MMQENYSRKCPKCGFLSDNQTDKFCIRCGTILPKRSPKPEIKKPEVKKQAFCPNCGEKITNLNYRFCTNCGKTIRQSEAPPKDLTKPIEKKVKFCMNCGKPLSKLPNIKFCKECGHPIMKLKNSNEDKEKEVLNETPKQTEQPEIQQELKNNGLDVKENYQNPPKESDEDNLDEYPESLGELRPEFAALLEERRTKKQDVSKKENESQALQETKELSPQNFKTQDEYATALGLIPQKPNISVPSSIPDPYKIPKNEPDIIPSFSAGESRIDELIEEPVEEPVEEPAEKHVEKPIELSIEEAAKEPIEESEPIEEPIEEIIEKPTFDEQPLELPTEEPIEELATEVKEEQVETPGMDDISGNDENSDDVIDALIDESINETRKEGRNYKKVKVAICPKCQRHCMVVGAEKIESNNWITTEDVKRLETGQYLVRCPGCGVYFVADITLAVPTWEEHL